MKLVITTQVQKIKECLEAIELLEVPQHLQSVALQYLLTSAEGAPEAQPKRVQLNPASTTTGSLREYAADLNLKTAVMEIPALLYWAASNESAGETDERGIVELYRRAGLRPPKNITQSLRDLASKKYGRLEAVTGRPGFVKLTRVGEDFVIHDVIEKSKKKAG